MKTAVSIPDQIFLAADKLAEELGTTRSGLYARALADFLERRRQDLITDRINEVYLEPGPGLDPVLKQAQARALPKDDTW
ncbi:MAG: hypothetical protein FD129_314 [bacterium]|nr:MAG: hypothetical protein FD129_314 [bacterium]